MASNNAPSMPRAPFNAAQARRNDNRELAAKILELPVHQRVKRYNYYMSQMGLRIRNTGNPDLDFKSDTPPRLFMYDAELTRDAQRYMPHMARAVMRFNKTLLRAEYPHMLTPETLDWLAQRTGELLCLTVHEVHDQVVADLLWDPDTRSLEVESCEVNGIPVLQGHPWILRLETQLTKSLYACLGRRSGYGLTKHELACMVNVWATVPDPRSYGIGVPAWKELPQPVINVEDCDDYSNTAVFNPRQRPHGGMAAAIAVASAIASTKARMTRRHSM